ncbi:ATP-binding cassette domain-containing protein [Selenomonas sp. ND2010]|uniref:ABC transporter ATP-binding protein n=1 Tax=Selenomonas sp. ND2010 TaxID=1410618 RepID=UPI00051BDB22|nr:ATP-binding cassette domain-containing protein [Selenomonas sp. ND2010]
MITIKFEAVTQSFYGRTIFQDINAKLRSGTITAVTGQNGSGKSTLLKLAAHFMLPAAGRVSVVEDARELRREELRNRLAMVTPELRFYPRLTARENLAFLLGLRGIELTETKFQALLARVGLRDQAVATTVTGEFSTGMRQRLKLAALLAAEADIWLLDEPGANLDAAGRELVLREARQAADEGRLVLWATNDEREEAAADAAIHLAGH